MGDANCRASGRVQKPEDLWRPLSVALARVVKEGSGVTQPQQLGPPPQRRLVEAAHARALVRDQFPQWGHLPVEPVPNGGWDNCTFRLGQTMVLRLPSAAEYAEAVEKEHRWLPILAQHVPLPIPVPLAKGSPTDDFPHPWSVYPWLEGRPASADLIADHRTFARDLAVFLTDLQEIETAGGPPPGIHNWFRGGALRTFDSTARRALDGLKGLIDVDRAERQWEDSLNTPSASVDRWFHGDVAAGNLLVDDAGQLSAIIDFETCGVGDPACDLAVAWTLLSDEGRQVFFDALETEDTTWNRGRGWALWKALATARSAMDDPRAADEFEQARRTLDTILDG